MENMYIVVVFFIYKIFKYNEYVKIDYMLYI